MKKYLTLTILLFCFSSGSLLAQNKNRDSIKREAFIPDQFRPDSTIRDSLVRDSLAHIEDTDHMGKRDGRRLRLSKIQWQKFNHDMRNAGSDLFKPTLHTVSDTLLLKDSVYVHAFRIAAYYKALKDQDPGRTVGHYILMGSVKVLIAIPYYTLAFFFCHSCSFPPHYEMNGKKHIK